MVQHWDGTSWHPQYFRGIPLSGHTLWAVAATSPRNAWAVGDYIRLGRAPHHTWIGHWDGTAWTRAPSPSPGSLSHLYAVAATSPDNAWAVGSFGCSGCIYQKTLIEHWDGTAWTRVPSPSPGPYSGLFSVAATSPDNAWAVGGCLGYCSYGSPDPGRALILHWDGTAWTQVPSPRPGPYSALNAVAATSPDNAWAVGNLTSTNRDGSVSFKGLIEHWDGTAWTQVPGPRPGPDIGLVGVTATSPDNAWATGGYGDHSGDQPLIEHWDGTAWTVVPGVVGSPPRGVTATSPNNAWAVGEGS
jgi:hypothetical protein